MAEGFEPCRVPEQSRRDKLRVISQNQTESLGNLQEGTALLPIYDPSFISSDLVNPAVNFHCQSISLGTNATTRAKEGTNLMSFFGGMNMISAAASSSAKNHLYVDPQSSVQLNPSTIQDIDDSPFVFTPHIFRVLDQSFHGNEGVGYKPQSLSTGHEVNSNCAATNGQSLSLSLSSHQTQQSNHLPLELNLQRYDASMFCNYSKINEGYLLSGTNNGDGEGCSSTSLIDQFSRSSVPLGPFTGFASVLKGSKFLKPAQQLLEELSEVGREIYAEKFVPDSSLLDPPTLEYLNGNGIVDDSSSSSAWDEQTSKKSRLLTMLHEVYKRYKLYHQQMQSVFATFESIAGLSSATPFANLALKSMSKHFKCLKNAITDQLQFTAKSYGKIISEKGETRRSDNSVKAGTYGQRPLHMTGFVDQPVWRPQRGLPERAVTVLRAWLFEHFLHPYPTDTDKIILAKQTGLSRNQVSNWFINARVRLWKPMVEEIHSLESSHALNKSSQREEEEEAENRLKNSVELENPSFSIPRNGDFPLKRTRNHDMTENTPRESEMNWECDNTLPHNLHLGVGEIHSASTGVSLTLGLHQNNMGVSECCPLNPGRHFGLDSHGNGEAYLVSGFIGGQVILHDFVG